MLTGALTGERAVGSQHLPNSSISSPALLSSCSAAVPELKCPLCFAGSNSANIRVLSFLHLQCEVVGK